MDELLEVDIAKLLTSLPKEEEERKKTSREVPRFFAAAFDAEAASTSSSAVDAPLDAAAAAPFRFGFHEGVEVGKESHLLHHKWIVDEDRTSFDEAFDNLAPVEGKIGAVQAKSEFDKSKLPNSVLNKVWRLADVDGDGLLDRDEFCLAMYLINVKLKDYDLPETLPVHLTPPSKRDRREAS